MMTMRIKMILDDVLHFSNLVLLGSFHYDNEYFRAIVRGSVDGRMHDFSYKIIIMIIII